MFCHCYCFLALSAFLAPAPLRLGYCTEQDDWRSGGYSLVKSVQHAAVQRGANSPVIPQNTILLAMEHHLKWIHEMVKLSQTLKAFLVELVSESQTRIEGNPGYIEAICRAA